MIAPSLSPRSHTPKGARAREKILAVAERLFAEHGFHGASMRDVATEAAIPLANVVYHFTKKEKLYGAVLAEIGEGLVRDFDDALAERRDPPARLDAVVRALVAWSRKEPRQVKLLVRELLDNPARVAKATKLPLAPVLVRLAELIEEGIRVGVFQEVVPEAAALHLVGALSYFVAARPTLRRIVGAAREAKIEARYEREAISFARSMLVAGARRSEG